MTSMRLVHERAFCTRASPLRVGGIAIGTHGEIVTATRKSNIISFDIGTGMRRVKYAHPGVQHWDKSHGQYYIIGELAVGGKHMLVTHGVQVRPPTSLNIHGFSSEYVRLQLVDYETGRLTGDVDAAALGLGRMSGDGVQVAPAWPTMTCDFIVSTVPPEGRVASVDVKTGEVHRVGPPVTYGWPNPATAPLIVPAGGDWMMVDQRAPFLWNAKSGESVMLDVDAVLAWMNDEVRKKDPASTFTHINPMMFNAVLVGPGKSGDANDLRGRALIAGGHLFDAATGAWRGKVSTHGGCWFCGDPAVTTGFHGGLVLYEGEGTRTYEEFVKTSPRTYQLGIHGLDVATGRDVLLCQADYGVAVPPGVPPGRVLSSELQRTGVAWTPDGRRVVVASTMWYKLDLQPCFDECERRWPNMIRDTIAVPARRAFWRSEHGRGRRPGKAVPTIDAGAIQHAAEAWSESGVVCDGDGEQIEPAAGGDGELDLDDVVDAFAEPTEPTDWVAYKDEYGGIKAFTPPPWVLVRRLQVDVFRLERA